MKILRGLREVMASYLQIDAELPMVVKTRVFDLGKYRSLPELARSMGVSVSEVYRVRQGERSINQKFILGAIKAFPEYRFGELFYITNDDSLYNRTFSTRQSQ
jgi:hypothetical protein